MAGKKHGKLGRDVKRGNKTQQRYSADLWTYAQAARYLGIAEATLQAWVECGTHAVPVVHLGRLVRFRQASLDRWLLSVECNTSRLVPATAAAVGAEAL